MATCYDTNVSITDANYILEACRSLKVSDVWRSVGTCIFFELGRLRRVPEHSRRQGQITIMIESDWRIVKPRSIQIGSRFSEKRIDHQVPKLVGVNIAEVIIEGTIPELAIELDDRRGFRTFTCWDRQPKWSIGFRDHTLFPLDPGWRGIDVTPWIHARAGRIAIEYCYDDSKASTRNAVKKMGFV